MKKPLRLTLLVAVLSTAASQAVPLVTCPEPATVPCNSTNTVSVFVADPQTNDLGVVWAVNGIPMQTNSIPASEAALGTNVTFTAVFPLGTNVINVVAADNSTNSASCGTIITVVDTNPPVIVSVNAAPGLLWPPNHKMRAISVHAEVTDDCSSTTWKIISVSSNEAEDAHGSGHTAPDTQIIGDHACKVRAERSGNGSGRVYTITIQAADSSGNLSEPATATVTVPHDQGHKNNPKPPKPSKPSKPGKGNGHGKG